VLHALRTADVGLGLLELLSVAEAFDFVLKNGERFFIREKVVN
jgi:magnesium-transporting ATPase (P-type)